MQTGGHPAATYLYDTFGRVSQVTDAGGHVTKTYYKTSGLRNTDSTEVPGPRRTKFRYDIYGRSIATVFPDGRRDSVTYDGLGRVTTSTDGLGRTTTFAYDSLFLTSVTDARSQVTSFTRNVLGWITEEYRPGSSTPLKSWYARDGSVDSVRNRRSHTIRFTYDALGRVVSRDANGSVSTYAYQMATPSTTGFVVGSNAESLDTIFISSREQIDSVVTRRGSNWYQQAYTYHDDGQPWITSTTSNRWTGARDEVRLYNATGSLSSFGVWGAATTLNPGTTNEDIATHDHVSQRLGVLANDCVDSQGL